jgi:hypothetical protein
MFPDFYHAPVSLAQLELSPKNWKPKTAPAGRSLNYEQAIELIKNHESYIKANSTSVLLSNDLIM